MTILIKGMEMPKDGAERCIIIRPDGTIRTFYGTKIEYLKAVAVPIPTPHGRLGDLDALVAKFHGIALGENSLLERFFADGVYAVIDCAPTIIEAEE